MFLQLTIRQTCCKRRKYNEISRKIEKNLKSLFNESSSEELFTQTSERQINKLVNLVGASPVKFIDFYRENQPNSIPGLRSNTILLNVDGILEENTDRAPGVYLSKLGIFVFAVTIGGNVICIDINDMENGDPVVLLIDHSFCYCDSDDSEIEIVNLPSYINESDFLDEDFEFNYKNVRKFVYKIENSFVRFMEKYSLNQFDDLEMYL